MPENNNNHVKYQVGGYIYYVPENCQDSAREVIREMTDTAKQDSFHSPSSYLLNVSSYGICIRDNKIVKCRTDITDLLENGITVVEEEELDFIETMDRSNYEEGSVEAIEVILEYFDCIFGDFEVTFESASKQIDLIDHKLACSSIIFLMGHLMTVVDYKRWLEHNGLKYEDTMHHKIHVKGQVKF